MRGISVVLLLAFLLGADAVRRKSPGGRNRASSGGIYPTGHWDHATKLTDQGAFNTFIKENVDAGKTVFVRTIASDG